jgi:hypothetical protein
MGIELLISPLIKLTDKHVTALTVLIIGTVLPIKGAARVPSANPIGVPNTPPIIFTIVFHSDY